MIIDIGTGVDESVVKWKYNDKDKWRDADIDELIHLYESVVHCKDCKWYEQKQKNLPYAVKKRYCNRSCTLATKEDDFCSYGERREE